MADVKDIQLATKKVKNISLSPDFGIYGKCPSMRIRKLYRLQVQSGICARSIRWPDGSGCDLATISCVYVAYSKVITKTVKRTELEPYGERRIYANSCVCFVVRGR